jgi:hypothetical protein
MQDELAIVLSAEKQSKQQEAEQRLREENRVEQSRGASTHKKQRRVESKQRRVEGGGRAEPQSSRGKMRGGHTCHCHSRGADLVAARGGLAVAVTDGTGVSRGLRRTHSRGCGRGRGRSRLAADGAESRG